VRCLRASTKTDASFDTAVLFAAREPPFYLASRRLKSSDYKTTHGTSNVLYGEHCDDEDQNWVNLYDDFLDERFLCGDGIKKRRKEKDKMLEDASVYLKEELMDFALGIHTRTGSGGS
jgi:hypothetical protein